MLINIYIRPLKDIISCLWSLFYRSGKTIYKVTKRKHPLPFPDNTFKQNIPLSRVGRILTQLTHAENTHNIKFLSQISRLPSKFAKFAASLRVCQDGRTHAFSADLESERRCDSLAKIRIVSNFLHVVSVSPRKIWIKWRNQVLPWILGNLPHLVMQSQTYFCNPLQNHSKYQIYEF